MIGSPLLKALRVNRFVIPVAPSDAPEAMSISEDVTVIVGERTVPLKLAKPPAESVTSVAAVTSPIVRFPPAAACILPLVTGPPMVIEPPVGTGARARTMFGSKLPSPLRRR